MTYDPTITAREIRAHVAERYEAEKIRITRQGEVHALGIMPNTNQRGWFFAGYDTDIALQIQQERAGDQP